jgi:signal transduction histidine kinase
MFSVSARKALTGRWAISRTPYLVIAPTTIASVVLLEAKTFHFRELGAWLVASGVGYLVFCVLLYLAHLSIFRNRAIAPVPIAWIFTIGFTFGAIKGVTTGWLSFVLALEPNLRDAISSRFFAAGFLGLVGVPSVAIVMNALEEFRAKRIELIAEQILIESKELQSQEVIAEMSKQLRSTIESDLVLLLDGLRHRLDEKSSNSESWQLIADDLRATAKETVRDMSHRLWDRPSSKVADITLIDIAKAMITTSAFPLRFIIPILLASSVPVNLNDHAVGELPIRLLALSLTTSAIYVSANFAIKHWVQFKYHIYSIALVLAAIMPAIYTTLLFHDTIDAHFAGVTLTIAIWLPVLTITCGLIDTSLKQRQEILDDLQARIDRSRVRTISENNETIRLSNDMAKYLHGNLQSRLMASAFAIEAAGNAKDSKSLTAEIEKARQSIETPFDQFTTHELGSVSDELTRLMVMWEGILSTELILSGSNEHVSSTDTRNIIHVVEEAFSNSLRHGLATEATILLTPTNTGTSLTVIDNGIGPRDGSPGLGSSLFNSIAGSNWSLTRGPEGIGAQLVLQITK